MQYTKQRPAGSAVSATGSKENAYDINANHHEIPGGTSVSR